MDKYQGAIEKLRKDFVEICKSIFDENLVAIINKGSSVKGGFIPGLSDIDMHVYLKDEVFIYSDYIKLEYGLALQQKIDELLKRYDLGESPVQVIMLNISYPKRWAGDLPGTYLMLYGDENPEPESIPEEMLEADRFNLLSPYYFYNLVNSYADKSNEELPEFVRKINPAVTPSLYRVLSLITRDPLKVWTMTRFDVLDSLECLESEEAKKLARLGHDYFALAGQRDRLKTDPELCRKALKIGFEIIYTGKEFAHSFDLHEK